MCGPYYILQHLVNADSATETAIYTLRQYVLGRQSEMPDVMTILAWVEDNHANLEAACDEMRSGFVVPPWDRDLKKWITHKAFNMIIAEINRTNAYVATGTTYLAATAYGFSLEIG